MKALIIAIVVGVLVSLLFRSCHHQSTPKPADDKGGFFGAFKKAAQGNGERLGLGKDGKAKTGAFDIWGESLRAQCGPDFIRTDGGQYEVGRMSNKGLVVAIRDRVVRIIEPDGRNGFVVCDDMSAYVPNTTAAPPAVVGSDIAKGTPAENGKALYRTGAASDGGLSRTGDPLQAGRVAVPVDGPPSPPFGSSPLRGVVWVPVETVKPPEGAVGKSPNAAPWYPSAVPNW